MNSTNVLSIVTGFLSCGWRIVGSKFFRSGSKKFIPGETNFSGVQIKRDRSTDYWAITEKLRVVTNMLTLKHCMCSLDPRPFWPRPEGYGVQTSTCEWSLLDTGPLDQTHSALSRDFLIIRLQTEHSALNTSGSKLCYLVLFSASSCLQSGTKGGHSATAVPEPVYYLS